MTYIFLVEIQVLITQFSIGFCNRGNGQFNLILGNIRLLSTRSLCAISIILTIMITLWISVPTKYVLAV